MSLRRSDSKRELTWQTAQLEDGEWYVDFHETEDDAKAFAAEKYQDAKDSGESCQVYVSQVRWQS